MNFCEFLTTYGGPPEDCTLLQGYIDIMITELSSVNQTRYIETIDAPTAVGLTALWAPCDVPIGAMAFWVHTVPSPDDWYQWFYDETEHWVLLEVRAL